MPKEIQCTRNKIVIVDDGDYDKLIQYKWQYNNKWGYISRSKMGDGKQSTWYMHWDIMGKPPKGMDIDHINRDKLDNRKENLRMISHRENLMNGPMRKNNTSGYKGISWYGGKINKWYAKISINDGYIRLGPFVNKDDAIRAYNDKINKIQ